MILKTNRAIYLVGIVFLVLTVIIGCDFQSSNNIENDTENSNQSTINNDIYVPSYTVKENLFDSSGIIYGEINNRGSVGYSKVLIEFKVYDSSNVLLETGYNYPFISSIPSEKTYPFVLHTNVLSSLIDHIDFVFSCEEISNDNPERSLYFQNTSEAIDYKNDLSITGELYNAGEGILSNCRAILVCYDELGDVIYCKYSTAKPSTISSHYSHPFTIDTDLKKSDIYEYKLISSSSSNYEEMHP